MIDLSVVIISDELAPFLDACLDSLARGLSGLSYEVVVVDNASSDTGANLVARRARVGLIRNPVNRGFAAAANQGMAATTGRVVMWLNPDSVLLDEGAVALVRSLDEQPDVGVIGPRILDPDGRLQRSARAFPSYDWAVGHRHSWLTRLLPNNPYSRRYLLGDLDMSVPQPVDWVSGACLLYRRALVDAIGGLDERFFMYCEDVDFCLRAKQAGLSVRYDPRMQVRHQVAGSTRLRPRRMLYERNRSLWRYCKKHFPRRVLVDPVAWAAISGRCGLVVAGNTARGLWGRVADRAAAPVRTGTAEALGRRAARIVASPAKPALDATLSGVGLLGVGAVLGGGRGRGEARGRGTGVLHAGAGRLSRPGVPRDEVPVDGP